MKLSEMAPGTKHYAALSRRVIAVLSRSVDGYRVYLDAVPGARHDEEWQEVAVHGVKQPPDLAEALVRYICGRHVEIDVPYAR